MREFEAAARRKRETRGESAKAKHSTAASQNKKPKRSPAVAGAREQRDSKLKRRRRGAPPAAGAEADIHGRPLREMGSNVVRLSDDELLAILEAAGEEASGARRQGRRRRRQCLQERVRRLVQGAARMPAAMEVVDAHVHLADPSQLAYGWQHDMPADFTRAVARWDEARGHPPRILAPGGLMP